MTDGNEKTTYSFEVTTWAHPAGRGPVETTLVRGSTPDPKIAAATLRAAADQLDPLKAPGPVWRGGAVALDPPKLAEARPLGPYSWDTPETAAALRSAGRSVTREAIERAARRPRATLADEPDPVVLSTTGPPVEPWMWRQAGGARCAGNACAEGHTYVEGCLLKPADAPMYAHDPECNTLHDGPDPCPPPVTIEALTPAAAEVVARVGADRRTRITPDGCGPEHTFTGSCAYAQRGRTD
jgi:hypothetical protein